MYFVGSRRAGLPLLLAAGACALVLAACGDDHAGAAGGEGSDGARLPVSSPPAPSEGCSAAVAEKGFRSGQSLTTSGAARTYQLFVPDSYDGQTPLRLVFVFHGDGGSGTGIRGSFKQLEVEAAGNAILVYPDGESKTWRIDGAAGLSRDVGFIDALAEDVSRTYCIDKKRIFSVGFSRGAYFANMLGCVSNAGFRAVVAHGGGGPFGSEGAGTTFDGKGQLVCPRPPVAALQVIGESDGLLGEAKKSREYWQRANGCEATTRPYAPSPCLEHVGCAGELAEVYCQIPGLGHKIWPEGSKVTWAFLAGL